MWKIFGESLDEQNKNILLKYAQKTYKANLFSVYSLPEFTEFTVDELADFIENAYLVYLLKII